jgi:hypothetical protein
LKLPAVPPTCSSGWGWVGWGGVSDGTILRRARLPPSPAVARSGVSGWVTGSGGGVTTPRMRRRSCFDPSGGSLDPGGSGPIPAEPTTNWEGDETGKGKD